MLALEEIKGRAIALRFSPAGSEGTVMPPITATGLIEFVEGSKSVAWIKILTGALKRFHLRLLTDTLDDLGIKEVVANRMEGHVLPFATVDVDGNFRVSVERLVQRFGRYTPEFKGIR